MAEWESSRYDDMAEELKMERAADAWSEYIDHYEDRDFTGGSGCPAGCRTHKPDCDIKGNISFDTDEKIYHVPGAEFYEQTTINPDYGERWFCTEEETLANGWRKAKN